MQYEIKCAPFPVVVCGIQQGESMITESGAMAWMTPGIEMQTKGGSVGKALGRLFTGESLFLNIYTAQQPDREIAFAAKFPGKIIPIEISQGYNMVVQKSGFLACTSGVELSIAYKKKISASLFGGEGFIMQKLSGQGTAFIEIDGDVVPYELQAGEVKIINTGALAMMDESVTMEIEMVKGVKNIFFGGEGLFLTKVTGPGRIWLQTMPISNLAESLIPYLPSSSNG